MSTAIINTDGSSIDGLIGIGYIIQNEVGEQITKQAISVKRKRTNSNVAEQYAIIYAVKDAIKRGYKKIQIFTDSQNVRIMTKNFQRGKKVKRIANRLTNAYMDMLRAYSNIIKIYWIPRKYNRAADKLAGKYTRVVGREGIKRRKKRARQRKQIEKANANRKTISAPIGY